ncbi:hypothetical protein [Actinomadura parmotrematis]|uniref:Uncharacterized protein n=1 Tax=Actinomadura parmotrematis TaxID=2864039 RepID=A0ABS7FMJ2_9ACTN|nr:hypothetical protein [Actinomadura parmotrematis]MBW8481450.1 hypothetical protein [Actinomadura parmotrematis]
MREPADLAAALGGKSAGGWGWSFSPLNSAGSASKVGAHIPRDRPRAGQVPAGEHHAPELGHGDHVDVPGENTVLTGTDIYQLGHMKTR